MKTLKELYEEILKNQDLNYYHICEWSNQLSSILTDIDAKNFIHSIINKGKKESTEINKMIETIDSQRCLHIVSTYLLGISFYSNPYIKLCVDVELQNLPTSDTKMIDRFLYVWFLICFFHDLGYAYEEEKLLYTLPYKKQLIYKSCNQYVPDIFDSTLIRNYKRYRSQCMCTKDHGIYGANAVYKELIGHLAENHRNKGTNKKSDIGVIFNWNPNLIRVLRCISNIIAIHNIFFISTRDHAVKCYRHHELDKLIYSGEVLNPRVITLKKHPLLFLFDLVDSIEPLKSLNNIEQLKEIQIEFLDNESTIYIHCPGNADYEKFRERIVGIKSWLTDVEGEKEDTLFKIFL